MSSLIRLENSCKTYSAGTATHRALDRVNLTIEKGEMTAIVGKSGSGKSTLMNIIGFLDVPSAGHYYFAGEDVSCLSDDALAAIRNQQIGFIFQSFFLLPRSTILQNVMLPLFYRGTSPTDAQQKARSLLAKVGLSEMAAKYPNQLSGGQQQRVAIARALVGDPAIILADEPTGALDSQTSADIMQLLHQLNRDEGRTILIITHDPAISSQCRRVLTIGDGVINDQNNF